MSVFWSGFVIVITVGSMIGYFWLLESTRHGEVKDGQNVEKDHVFDGIRELETPLPAWWYWMFVITIIYSAIFLVLYPGLGSFKGLLGWSQVGQLEAEIARADKRFGPIFAGYLETPVEELVHNQQANRMGRRLFANNCSTCHGAAGTGAFGFPNLTDDSWQWGEGADRIRHAIVNGLQAAMPAWEAALGDDGIKDTANYVRKLAGLSHDETAAKRGKGHFDTLCVACHMADGSGMAALGAPSLTDDVWLYGGSLTLIEQTLRYGRNGMMPAHDEVLDPARIHLLTAYVMSLSAPVGGASESAR